MLLLVRLSANNLILNQLIVPINFFKKSEYFVACSFQVYHSNKTNSRPETAVIEHGKSCWSNVCWYLPVSHLLFILDFNVRRPSSWCVGKGVTFISYLEFLIEYCHVVTDYSHPSEKEKVFSAIACIFIYNATTLQGLQNQGSFTY